jgi:hypothetical protein
MHYAIGMIIAALFVFFGFFWGTKSTSGVIDTLQRAKQAHQRERFLQAYRAEAPEIGIWERTQLVPQVARPNLLTGVDLLRTFAHDGFSDTDTGSRRSVCCIESGNRHDE